MDGKQGEIGKLFSIEEIGKFLCGSILAFKVG